MSSTNIGNEQTANDGSSASASATSGRPCAYCGGLIEPRKHGGGRPQKFCGDECRLAYYAEADRSKRKSTPLRGEESFALKDRPKAPSIAQHSCSPYDEFDWHENIAIREQANIAIYWSQAGDLVIRQQRSLLEEHDTCIIVNGQNAQLFIDQLCDVIGIGNAGR